MDELSGKTRMSPVSSPLTIRYLLFAFTRAFCYRLSGIVLANLEGELWRSGSDWA
jgi:hypothetical protein